MRIKGINSLKDSVRSLIWVEIIRSQSDSPDFCAVAAQKSGGDTAAVLDGDLDAFMAAALAQRVKGGSDDA